MIIAGVVAVTAVVVMLNAADTVAPAATVTVAGAVAAPLLLISITTAPPAGAGPFSVTVFAVVDPPPTTDAGDNVTTVGTGGCTVRVPVPLPPP